MGVVSRSCNNDKAETVLFYFLLNLVGLIRNVSLVEVDDAGFLDCHVLLVEVVDDVVEGLEPFAAGDYPLEDEIGRAHV